MITSPQLTTPATTLGVFDSGVGGLTVLRALAEHLPRTRYIYLGDTARLPYGSKSRATVVRYAVSAAEFLADQGAAMLVIACNTASALALAEIRAAVAPLPVVGVIEPGAEAALAHLSSTSHVAPSHSGSPPRTLVLATAATVASHAYQYALHSLGLAAVEKSCPLLVPLVEEGWTDHPVTADVLRIYLREALTQAPHASTLLLGCTHYPLLRPLFERVLSDLNQPMTIIDSAFATAQAVAAALAAHPEWSRQALTSRPHPPANIAAAAPDLIVYATDGVDRFQSLGSRFLGSDLPPVQLIDLGG